MAHSSLIFTIAHPWDRSRRAEVNLTLGTRATLSWVPREVVERLELPRLPRRRFLLRDGSTIERETAAAIVELSGNFVGASVVVAESGDRHHLGMTTLESLGLAFNPAGARLVPKPLLAMSGQQL